MALVAATVVLAHGPVNGVEPEAQATAPLAGAAAGQSMPAPDAETAVAEAIGAGTVLKEMTMDQVLSARGEPLRKQVIPPDAALWHYADGEVAFSSGRVSYVDLDPPQRQEALAPPSPKAAAPRRIEKGAAAKAAQSADTAKVHAPGDGFLALRSEPTIRRGKRVLKIPHGTELTLGECVTRRDDGGWCRTSYQGRTGWVAEQFLVRIK
jgi:hypothetical protein